MTSFFFGSIIPDPLVAEITEKSIGPISNANNLLQHNLISGLNKFENDLIVFNIPNVGSYPNRYKSLRVNGANYYIGNIEVISSKFFNLMFLKYITKFFSIMGALKKTLYKCKPVKYIYVYDIDLSFLLAAILLKIKNSHAKICLIVPDLPGHTAAPNHLIDSVVTRLLNYPLSLYISKVDCFAFLTQQMNVVINKKNRPHVVVEGIWEDVNKTDGAFNISSLSNKNVLFYSGSLDLRNGIEFLLDTLNYLEDDYQLIICGDGPFRSKLIERSYLDKRIIYMGQIPHADVISIQKQCTLLINPRKPIGDFVNYSFPSKTIEYFASGVPVLMYRLPGVPSEYYLHCYSTDAETPHDLAVQVRKICNTPFRIRFELARSASLFINTKNQRNQCKKIVDMISCII